MENMGGGGHEQEAMDLPPGFRFHPTDEELISHYLTPKAVDNSFCAVAIGEVDLNKCEPWDLPRKAKMGEKEWYFFCVKDRKYPTGMRTNRATDAGYWKATGKDKEIFRGRALVGMKKTLVFYRGRAPKGEKSNWVMHEYRLEGRISLQNLPSNAKNEWVICRIFHKNAGGKKIAYPILTISNSFNSEFSPSGHLPPLMESSPSTGGGQTKLGTSHVSCFSNPVNPAGAQSSQPDPNFSYSDTFFNNDLYHSLPSTSNPTHYFPRLAGTGPVYPPQSSNFAGDFMFSGQQFLRSILDNNEGESKQGMKTEGVNHSASQETGLSHDMNAEIISVVSNFSPGPRSFEDLDAPSTSSYDAFLNFSDV